MPPPNRKVDPEARSARAILDDLHLARDALGIDLCGVDRLQATLCALDDDRQRNYTALLPAARELLRRHVDEVCNAFAAEHVDDTCAVAAADSLAMILLATEAEPIPKASVVRKNFLSEYKCHLSADGLRKREDQILRLIAEAVADELEDLMRLAFPFSTTHCLMALEQVAEPLSRKIRELLRRFYKARVDVEDSVVDLAQEVLFDIGKVHFSCHLMLTLLTEPRSRSATDLWFGFLSYNVLTLPFESARERRILARAIGETLESGGDVNQLNAFLDSLHETIAGDQLVFRFEAVLRSCPDICEFERSNDVRQICRPHQLVLALEKLSATIAEWRAGTLESNLRADLGNIMDFF